MARNLEALFSYLDGLKSRPPLEELEGWLRHIDLRLSDLSDWVRFGEQNYKRNLVRAGQFYHLWVLCWRNGQRSPIHDHANSACAVRVLKGTATVTTFVKAPNGHVYATGSAEHPPGTVMCNLDDDMHQVSNLQANNEDLITLHVYTPPLLRMGTYSIMDALRGEDVWLVMSDGAGI
jgi:cysteine dioxygenase